MFDASQRQNSTEHDDSAVSLDMRPAQVEGLNDAADEGTAALAPPQDDDVLALDAALNATLADLAEASTLNVDPELETTVLFRYGALLTGPAVLDHVRRHLRLAEVRGEEAAMMVREGTAIVAAAGTSDTEAAHVASLAKTLERLSAIAQDDPGLSREEQVQWALASEAHD